MNEYRSYHLPSSLIENNQSTDISYDGSFWNFTLNKIDKNKYANKFKLVFQLRACEIISQLKLNFLKINFNEHFYI